MKKRKSLLFVILYSVFAVVVTAMGVLALVSEDFRTNVDVHYTYVPTTLSRSAWRGSGVLETAKHIVFDVYDGTGREYCAGGSTNLIANATASIDVSENQDKSIVAYVVGDTVYVIGDTKIYFPANSSNLFSVYSESNQVLTACESITFDDIDTTNVQSMNSMFDSCASLTQLDLSEFKTDQVTDMGRLFANTTALKSVDLTPLETTKLSTIKEMFAGSGIESIDLSDFDTRGVTDMSGLFQGCQTLATITGLDSLDTTKVTDMSHMFDSCKLITELDLSTFNTSNVTNMSYMFNWCSSLTQLESSNFDTSKVTDMSHMFAYTAFKELNLLHFRTYNVTNMEGMFCSCPSLTHLDISYFETSKVTNMSYMFGWCTKLTAIYAMTAYGMGWNTGKVTNSYGMFVMCEKVPNYNPSKTDKTLAYISNLSYLSSYVGTLNKSLYRTKYTSCFATVKSLTLDYYSSATVEKYNVDGVNVLADVDSVIDVSIDGNIKFYIAGTDGYVLSHREIKLPADSSSLFTASMNTASAVSYVEKIKFKNINTSKVTDMSSMFYNCTSLATLDLSSFDTSSVEYMVGMFYNCTSLVTLDLSSFDTSSVEYMGGMFSDCTSLATLDLSSFDTSSVTSMDYMFYNCTSLATLDLSSFDTSSVWDMSYMFYNCTSLVTLDLSSFDTSSVEFMNGMFSDCTSLATLDLSSFDTSSVEWMESMFSNCTALTRIYISSRWSTSAIQESSDMFLGCTKLRNYNASYVDHTRAHARADGYMSYFAGTLNKSLFKTCLKSYASTLTSLTFDYYSSESTDDYVVSGVNILASADAVFDVGSNGNAQFYIVGTDGYVLSHREIKLPADSSYLFSASTNTASVSFYVEKIKFKNINTSNVTSMSGMFSNCKSLATLDLSSFDTSSVRDMSFMFHNCPSLATLDLSSFDTSSVEHMSNMFNLCKSLTTLDLSSFDTSGVTSMSGMFSNCTSLATLDLSSFDTSSVTHMNNMFTFCNSLTTIYVSSLWKTSAVEYGGSMFQGCTKLRNYNASYVDHTCAHAGAGGYLTLKS